jgi:hypothetical protein
MEDLDTEVSEAVKYFWSKLSDQAEAQRESEQATRGRRAEVLGGRQLDGFASLCEDILQEVGVPEESIFHDHAATLPGYYRATKRWDLAVVHDDELLAVIEFKSISSSFGNNLNNRVEEALGNPTDLYAAYEEGAFEPSPNPWMGYFLLMAETEDSTSPVTVQEPHFNVFDEYKDASYVGRSEQLCLRMLRKRLYNGCAFLLSDEERGLEGEYVAPHEELSFHRFVSSLTGHIRGFLEYEGTTQETLEF